MSKSGINKPVHTMKKFASAALLSTALIATSAETRAQTFSLEGTIFDVIATTYKLDPLLLYSIAITESATGTGTKGIIAPHPFVIRTDDGAQWFDTKQEAEAALAKALEESQNIDVGLMQINLRWHPQPDPLAMLDPVANLSIAAAHLKETLASTPDPVLGVGRYHSWRDELSVWYGQRVWKTYNNLVGITN